MLSLNINYRIGYFRQTSCTGLDKLDFVIKVEEPEKLIGVQCKRLDRRKHIFYDQIIEQLYKFKFDYLEQLDPIQIHQSKDIPVTLVFIDISD